jgi:hypothetical protein
VGTWGREAQVISIITANIRNMSYDVQLVIRRSPIPLKYVGDTGVQSLPCTVGDLIDQGVLLCDGRFSDEACWEGEGVIISPAFPAGTRKTYQFTDPDLGPADPRYTGALAVNLLRPEGKRIDIMVFTAPPVVTPPPPPTGLRTYGGRAGIRQDSRLRTAGGRAR